MNSLSGTEATELYEQFGEGMLTTLEAMIGDSPSMQIVFAAWRAM
jgi:hypothetical protein